jgi:hypothetical protein
MKVFSLLRVIALIFAFLAIVSAFNPVDARGMRQGETLPAVNHTNVIDIKSYLVTFTHPDTPDRCLLPVDSLLTPFSIVDSAIDAIIQAGGKLTHRFKKLIKYDHWLVATIADYVGVSLSMLLLVL